VTEKRSGLAHQLAQALCTSSTILLLVGAAARTAIAADPRESLLKIYATQLGPDYGAPWRPGVARTVSGSGFVIADHRILTNAHVVSNATFLQVRRYGDSERVPARVLFVSHDADLALLTIDEPGFFDQVPALDLGDLPELREEVLVLGFPLGGDTLSITRGVVSRIEHQNYVHANASLLAGQIDSAVNPGNSGGPVLSQGKVVGVAMQVSSGSDNIAYMVPTPVIEQFVTDVADGRYDGVPEAAFRWQRLEAADLRQKYGLPSTRTGILVLDTVPGSAASQTLQPGDVLLSIDGHAIGTDGTIEFRARERTDFGLLLQDKQLGASVQLELLRGGKSVQAELRIDRPVGAGRLVPGPLYGERPPYYIFGGLAFCPLTVNYVQAWGEDWWNRAPRHLLALLQRSVRFEGEQAVVVCSVLRDELNSGYEEAAEDLIVKADGQPVRNLVQLVNTIESKSTGLLVLETQDGKQIVFDRERARREGPGILGRYQVARDRSEGLRASKRPEGVETVATAGLAASAPDPTHH
jgi:S1-C subfamily serine protease